MNIKSISLKIPLFLFLIALAIASSIKAEPSSDNTIPSAPEGTLIFAVDIIRHGDRTPGIDIPSSPYPWKEGLGQLTPVGMRQEYNLGKKFRARYVNNYHLLSENYTTGTIYVRSSDFDRTLMSAESLLLGFYPSNSEGPLLSINNPALPNCFQPIPIHTVPQSEEKLLIPDNPIYHFNDLLANHCLQTTAWKKKEAEVEPYLPAWSSALGTNITNFYQLRPLADVLRIRKLYNIPEPEGLSEEDVQKIMQVSDWGLVNALKNKAIATQAGTSFLQDIAAHLYQASTGTSPLKYVLYSGHDSSIMIAASALGAPLDDIPHYASDLNIALFDQGNKNYRVVLTYNDHPLILSSTGTSSCTLEQFFQLAHYQPGATTP